MDFKVIFCTTFMVVVLLTVAGCSGPAPQQPAATLPATSVPTQAVSTTVIPPSTAGGSTQPSPTDTLPAQWPLSFSVEKAGTYSTTLITHFDGGKGLSAVSKIDVRVTRPDGSVVTGNIKAMKGETLELEGTQGTDRVEILVTMNNGGVYKIIDQQMPYKTRG